MLGVVINIGLWRSLVARLHGAQEVVSSNLASPTNEKIDSFLKCDDPSAIERVFSLIMWEMLIIGGKNSVRL